MPKRTISVFDYLNYRDYLRAYYEHKKATQRGFSYRVFARLAEMGSPNYLKLVIDGQRNITPQLAPRFARACSLSKQEKAFFYQLVRLTHAESDEDKNDALVALQKFRPFQKSHKLELAHSRYHSNWYVPAVRELMLRSDFEESSHWIAKQMSPEISPMEAKRALAILEELSLIRRDEKGKLQLCDELVSTGPEMPKLHIKNYHRTMLKRAAASIDLFSSEERDISSLTLLLDEEGLRDFKARIQHFRRELLELSALRKERSQVVQINFQLFPLSKKRGENK